MPRNSELDPYIGQRLRELREARGLSLRALAGRVLSSKTQLHDFEAGRRRPSTDTLARLDAALGAGGDLVALSANFDAGRVPKSPGVGDGLEFAPGWPRAIEVAAIPSRLPRSACGPPTPPSSCGRPGRGTTCGTWPTGSHHTSACPRSGTSANASAR